MLKKTIYKHTNTCCHTYIKCFLVAGVRFLLSVFFLLLYLLLLEDEDPQNVRSGKRGEEKWPYSHGKTLVKFIQFHWQLEILHISCRFIELSTSDFGNILRLLLSVGFCTKSESLVKFIDQYYDLFFFLYVSGRDSHFEMFSGPDFEESYLNIWSLLPAAAKSVLFCLRHVKLYYHANQIWHVCNNLLDAMVHSVPYGNCFSWLKKNSQTLREERTLQQTMMNNETMLSECSTFLRDIRFGIRFLVKNVAGFSFTLNWFLFLHFFSSTDKKKT